MENQKKNQKISEQLEKTGAVAIEDHKVMTFEDIMAQNSSDDTVVKINRLMNYGADRGYIEKMYNEVTSKNKITEKSVINTDIALKNLKEVFTIVAINISEALNGIVIDLNTGKKDAEVSLKQAIQIGIKADTIPLDKRNKEGLKKYFEELFENINELKKEGTELTPQFIKENSSKDNFWEKIVNAKVSKEDIAKAVFLNEDQKEKFEAARKNVEETNPFEMRIRYLRSQIKADPLRSTEYVEELQKIMQEHPEYENISMSEETNDLMASEKYNEDLMKLTLFKNLEAINELGSKEISELDPKFKKKFLLLMAANIVSSSDEELAKTMDKVINKLNLDISIEKICNVDGKEIQKLGDLLGYKDFDVMKLMELGIKTSKIMAPMINKSLIEKNTEGKDITEIVSSQFEKILDETFDGFFEQKKVDMVIENFGKTEEQQYFSGSRLELSGDEEKAFKELYSENLILSWIPNKNQVLEKIYLGLVNRKEECIDEKELATKGELKGVSDQQDAKILWLDKAIKDFKEKYPDFDESKYLRDGRLIQSYKDGIKEFESAKFMGDLLKNYVESESAVRSPEDYEKLPELEKQKYLRDTLVGLSNESNPAIKKFAMRRLECISTKERSFIEFDKNNEPIINKKLIEDEYEKVMYLKRTDYDTILNRVTSRKNNQVRKKLLKAAIMPEQCFAELKGNTIEEQVIEIESMRLKNKALTKPSLVASKSTKSIRYTKKVDRDKEKDQTENTGIGKEDKTLTMNEREFSEEKNAKSNEHEYELEENDEKKGFFGTIITKIKDAVNRIRGKQKLLTDGNNSGKNDKYNSNMNKAEKSETFQEEAKFQSRDSNFIPIVKINERDVIKQMKANNATNTIRENQESERVE